MNDIIERLEAAEHGSRELDAEIHSRQLGADWYAKNQYEDGSGKWLCYCTSLFIDSDRKHEQTKLPPYYTESIDAAITLIPDGLWWVLNSGVQHPNHRSLAQVSSKERTGPISHEAHGATPALSLCTAALKAHTHE